jgi:excisionase family DNA binding protein
VAAELEARWNASLERVQQIERSLDQHRGETAHQPTASLDTLMTLADDLPAIWNDPAADMRIKQRIVRTLIHEIVADVDGTTNEIVLIIHWTGGRHSEVRIPKNKAGHTSRWTDPDAEKIICAMAGAWSDRDIALTLNRLRLRTGTRQTWTQSRVRSVRHRMKLPAYDPNQAERTSLSLDQAAAYLGVSTTTVRRLIHEKVIPAIQVVPGAPWQLRRDTLDAPQVRKALDAPRRRFARSRTTTPNDRTPMIPGLNGGGA